MWNPTARALHSRAGLRYHRRSLVETKMHCFKLLGERVASRTFDRQITEFKIRATVLNRFSQIGTPTTIRVA